MQPLGVGDRLRAARAAARLTQRDVGKALSCSTATVANWETERTAPSLADLGHLAALYCVSCDWLITGHARLPHRFETPSRSEGTCKHLVPHRDRCTQCEAESNHG